VLQTQSQLAPAYTSASSAAASPARARVAREDNSPWLFALATLSFALALAGVSYLSLISF
jgi:hypothetical protein